MNNQSDEKNANLEEFSTEFQHLFTRLHNYSDAYMADNQFGFEIRKNGVFWKRLKAFVAFDTSGTLISLLTAYIWPFTPFAIGLGASIFGAIFGDKIDINISVGNSEVPDINGVDTNDYASCVENIGKIHNLIIYNIYDKYGEESLSAMSYEEVFDIVLEELQFIDINAQVENKAEAIQRINTINSLISEGDINKLDAAMADYGISAESCQSFFIYMDTIDKIDSVEGIDNYTSNFISIIDKSSISEIQKLELKIPLKVAQSSNILWGSAITANN